MEITTILGDATPEEYLQGANNVIGREGIERAVRPWKSDTLYYDTSTNEFAVEAADGFIKTYFTPRIGVEYWSEQLADVEAAAP